MYSYPQYIYPPTTVPVQRYFANPHVRTNEYDLGGIIGGIGDKLGGVFGSKGASLMGRLGKIGIGGGVLSSIGSAVGNIGGKAISGGLNSGAGKAISGIGNAVGGVVGKFNPLLGAAVSAASGIIGGLTNRAFGSKLNDAAISAIDSDINSLNNTRVTDSSNESIANQATAQNWGNAFDKSTVGKDGWFANKAQKEFERLQRGMASSQNYMAANYDNASTNVQKNMMNNLLMNSAAYGGYFDNPFSHPGSGAIAYGLEQQNLANQQQFLGQMQAQQNQPQMPFSGGGNTFGCGGNKYCFGGRFFSDGGNLNSHGSDFTNGLVYIENGGTHEENPYQGVPMGYDQQGVPNVVEEGEIVIPKRLLGGDSDYVLSNRIPITEEFAAKYHLSPDLSIAQAAEKLTKESRENPNDIIIERTNTKLMREMRDMQEQIKQEMQQQQQQRQMAEQQYAQAMGIPQQAMSVPQEQEALNMQAMQEAAQQQAPEIQQPMMAFGGNLFNRGGYFGPVNMFATRGNKPAGNQYSPAYNKYRSWGQFVLPVIGNQFAELKGKSREEKQALLDKINALQDAYEAAGLYGDDLSVDKYGDEYKRVQELAQALGLNSAFTDDFFNQAIQPGSYRRQTPDKPTQFNPDSHLGAITQNRHYGIRTPEDEDSWKIVRDALRDNLGIEAYLNDGSDVYRYRLLDDHAPEDDAVPEYQFDENGNYIGPELRRDQYLTEEELGDFEDKIDKKNGVVAGQEQRDLLPTWQRMVPLWASGLGVLTDALGITNRPDYSDAASLEALAAKQRGYMPVSYKPIGQYLRPILFDPYQAMLNANAQYNQASRAIQDNSNGNAAMANASQVALSRNAMMANGAIAEAGQKFNADQERGRLDFGRNTDLANSQGIMNSDAQNAHNWRLGQGAYASLFGQALGLRQAERQAANAARMANLSNFVKGMSNYGKENAYINMVNTNAANQGYGYGDRRFGVDYRSPFFQIPED